MKSISTLALSAVLALTGAGFASAATTYHLTGSTAFRAAVVTAEINYLKNTTGTVPYGVSYGSSAPSSISASSQSVILASDSSIKFENNFSGSIAGVEAVNAIGSKVVFPTGSVASGSATFPSSGYATTAGTTTSLAGGGQWAGEAFNASSAVTESLYPDIVFSDVSSATAVAVIQNYVTGQGSFADNSTEASGVLGVVPFEFVANATTDVTDFANLNVTDENFADLYGGGITGNQPIAGSIFSGNSADTNIKVYPLGRDIDSGTRATALAETGYPLATHGAAATLSPVVQWYPLDTASAIAGTASTVNPIASFELVPASSVDGASLAAGNGGYASGGNMGTALTSKFETSPTPVTHTVLIGYIGLADLAGSIAADGGTNRQAPIQLGFNGSSIHVSTGLGVGALTAADVQDIEYGAYTFWTYEHEFFKANNSVDPTDVANHLQMLLANNGSNSLDVLSSGGVTFTAMKVARGDDGLIVQ